MDRLQGCSDDPEGLSLTREMMQTFREKKKREHEELFIILKFFYG